MKIIYLGALLRLNLRAVLTQWRQFLAMSIAMFLQNFMWFSIWIIFFGTVKTVHGWGLPELAIFNGTLAAGLGIGLLVAEGTRHIAKKIISGELDGYLTRPRHALPQLMLTQSNSTSLGDMVYGLCLLGFAHVSLYGFMLSILCALLIGGIFLAAIIIFQAMAFYLTDGSRLADQFFEMFVCLGSIPQQTQTGVVKLLLFTVVPAGFMVVLPVEIVRQHSLSLLLWLAMATLGYALLAIAAFNFGLRRYTSATGWKV